MLKMLKKLIIGNWQPSVLLRQRFNDYNNRTLDLIQGNGIVYSLNKYCESRGIIGTGYLTTDYRNFNKGKIAEGKDRVKHSKYTRY